jgi:signal transduction histidine kinase
MFLILASSLFISPDTIHVNSSVHLTALRELIKVSAKHKAAYEAMEEAFAKKDLDLAQKILYELIPACQDETCILLQIVKARIFYEKGLVTESIDQYRELVKRTEDYPEFRAYKVSLEAILANLLVETKQYKESALFLKRFLSQYDAKLRPLQAMSFLHNLGLCYLHLEKYDSAGIYLKKSLAIKEQMSDTLGLAISYMDIANLYYNQYKDNLAIPLFIKGLEYAKRAKKPEVLRNAYLNMSVVEENRNDHRKALSYRKEYEKIQKDLWNRDKVWELAEQEKKFEVSLREKEISRLEEHDKVQRAELAARNLQRNYLAGITFLLLVIAAGSVIGYRKVRKSNRLISHQKNELEGINRTKNRLFSIVAHDLKSPVVALQKANQKLSSAIAKKDESNIRAIAAENERITDNTFKLLNNVLLWALHQSNEIVIQSEEISVQRIVEQVVNDYEGPALAKGVRLVQEISVEHLIIADVNCVKIVLRNLLDNAIKFTQAEGDVKIQSSHQGNHVDLTVEDTGCGITSEVLHYIFALSGDRIRKDTEGKSGTGLGLVLCKSLVESNSGELKIESEGNGTRVTLRFKAA